MKKQATPATGAATTHTQKHSIVSKLGDYEKRCLERLMHGRCDRANLDQHIGTTNAPEYVRLLRAKGIEIITHKAKGLNRDGRAIWWGEYELSKASLSKAKALLGTT